MSASSAPSDSAPPRWLVALIGIVAVAAFLPTLGGGFLGDDFVYVSRFSEFTWSDWPRLFRREWSEGIWGFQLSELRPFAALSFMVDAQLWNGHATGYRGTNLALHLGATLLVLRLTWNYSRGSTAAALIAALVFALHPAHAEPVAWITGRVDLLATVCSLGFWLAAEKWAARGGSRRLIFSGAIFFVGIFSKELCLFAPILLLLRWLLVEPRVAREVWWRRLAVLGVVLLVLGFYAICRHAAFGANAATAAGGWNNEDAWRRQASYVGWLVPVMPFLGKTEWVSTLSPAIWRGIWLAVATFVVVGIALALKRRAARASEALFFTGVWYLVAVGGFLLIGYFTPRHLYFPTSGLAIGAGLVIGVFFRAGGVRTTSGIAIVVWCLAAHVVAVRSWQKAGALSREITATLNSRFAAAPPGTIALISVPEVLGIAYVWAWASPHALGRPFLDRPVPAADVLERPGNYYRPDHWSTQRQQVEKVRNAPAAIALMADQNYQVHARSVPPEELRQRANALASLARDGITSEEWTAWVTTLFEP